MSGDQPRKGKDGKLVEIKQSVKYDFGERGQEVDGTRRAKTIIGDVVGEV